MDGGETPDLRTNELEIRSEVFLCEGALVRVDPWLDVGIS